MLRKYLENTAYGDGISKHCVDRRQEWFRDLGLVAAGKPREIGISPGENPAGLQSYGWEGTPNIGSHRRDKSQISTYMEGTLRRNYKYGVAK